MRRVRPDQRRSGFAALAALLSAALLAACATTPPPVAPAEPPLARLEGVVASNDKYVVYCRSWARPTPRSQRASSARKRGSGRSPTSMGRASRPAIANDSSQGRQSDRRDRRRLPGRDDPLLPPRRPAHQPHGHGAGKFRRPARLPGEEQLPRDPPRRPARLPRASGRCQNVRW